MQVTTLGLALGDGDQIQQASALRHLPGTANALSCCLCACCMCESRMAASSTERQPQPLDMHAGATARSIYANVPFDQMHAPLVGPAHPYAKDGMAAGQKNHRSGQVEVCAALLTDNFWILG